MDEENKQEIYETGYEVGNRTAWRTIVNLGLSHMLTKNESSMSKEQLQVERKALIASLRNWCNLLDNADNDWPDDLNLVDVIEKHLLRGLL